MNPQRGLTLTFWLKVEQFSVGYDGIDVVFHCGSGSYQTPAMWFRDSLPVLMSQCHQCIHLVQTLDQKAVVIFSSSIIGSMVLMF